MVITQLILQHNDQSMVFLLQIITQDKILPLTQGCIGGGGGGARGGSAPLVKILCQVGGAQPPLLLHKIAYNVNACQLCDHQF